MWPWPSCCYRHACANTVETCGERGAWSFRKIVDIVYKWIFIFSLNKPSPVVIVPNPIPASKKERIQTRKSRYSLQSRALKASDCLHTSVQISSLYLQANPLKRSHAWERNFTLFILKVPQFNLHFGLSEYNHAVVKNPSRGSFSPRESHQQPTVCEQVRKEHTVLSRVFFFPPFIFICRTDLVKYKPRLAPLSACKLWTCTVRRRPIIMPLSSHWWPWSQ